MDTYEVKIIARIHTDFNEKFGIPRQSNLIPELQGRIVFEPEFRSAEAVRGLEGYDYLWLIWQFSEAVRDSWSPTVRPPRLGGNRRMGVFATRSPFRPNAIGLSSVALDRVEMDPKQGPVLFVHGVDLMDGTPLFDIKPYIAAVDSHPGAAAGFTDRLLPEELKLDCSPELMERIPEEKREALLAVLRSDPRPRYQDDPERIYGMMFGGRNIKFYVRDGKLTVTAVE